MKKRKCSMLFFSVMLMAALCLQGCGGQKEELVGYGADSGPSVGQMIDEKLYGDKKDENVTVEGETEVSEETEEEVMPENLEDRAKYILNNMTLEEKVYQMFIITPEDLTDYDSVNASTDITKGKLKEFPVGGLIYFAHNLIDRQQTTKMLNNTLKSSLELQGMPIFLCVDEEGGNVARVANNKNFNVKNVGTMSENADKDKAYAAGNVYMYLKRPGFVSPGNMLPHILQPN